MNDTAPEFATIAKLAAQIRASDMSPAGLAEVCLERIAALDPRLHAFIAIAHDRATRRRKG